MTRAIDHRGRARRGGGAAAYLLACLLASSPGAVAAQQQASGATQTSSQSGVNVKVTPRRPAPGAATWDFAVVLDTHSQELADDLTRTATLVTDDGRRLKPAGWAGAPPGGHHREGVLSFPAPDPVPGAFELHLSRPGESSVRVLRWKPDGR
ncbi:MAG: hypothetical protein KF755_16010 [Burkholderiaceae bacterium]|nr:hypothetical protein [Burkholderiaceae bacterium]